MRLGGSGRHIENQQSTRIQQSGQEVKLSGKIGQMLQNVEGEDGVKPALFSCGGQMVAMLKMTSNSINVLAKSRLRSP